MTKKINGFTGEEEEAAPLFIGPSPIDQRRAANTGVTAASKDAYTTSASFGTSRREDIADD